MSSDKRLLDYLPQYLVVGTGVVYAAGFLVVLAFLDRYGIRESGAEFWKARYIHIGILCVAFPFIVNGTILSLSYLILHGKYNKNLMIQRLMPIGILMINLEIVCFFLIMLTRRGASGSGIVGLSPMQWIIGITLVGVPFLLTFERLLERFSSKSPREDELSTTRHSISVISRWILALVVVGFDFWYFSEFNQSLHYSTPWIGYTYICFSLLLGVIISTATVYIKRQDDDDKRRAIRVLVVSIICPFCYLVILSFSYGIYQYIPATRGGGDFTVSPKVTISFSKQQTPNEFDKKYFVGDDAIKTKPLILIEETSWAFYLADPDEAGGPESWKSIGNRKPEILIVNKSEVAKIFSESRNPQK